MLGLAAASDRGEVAVLTRAAAAAGPRARRLRPAERRGLIAVREGRAEFRHPLARAAIYARSQRESRRRAHRALAEALPDADADHRAWHLALAAIGPDERAAAALEAAGARAQDRGAFQVASRAFERAAQLRSAEPDRGPLEYAAAECAWLGGDADRAEALLDSATGSGDDPGVALDVGRLRGHIATRQGPLGEATVILEPQPSGPPRRRRWCFLAEACQAAFLAGDPSGMIDAAGRALGARRREQRGPHRVFRTHLAGDGRHVRRRRRARGRADPSSRRPARGKRRAALRAAASGVGVDGAALAARGGSGRCGADRPRGVGGPRRRRGRGAALPAAAHRHRPGGHRPLDACRGHVRRGGEARPRVGPAHGAGGHRARGAPRSMPAAAASMPAAHAEEALGLAAAWDRSSFAVWAHWRCGRLEYCPRRCRRGGWSFEMVEALLAEGGVADADLSPPPSWSSCTCGAAGRCGRRAAGPSSSGEGQGPAVGAARAWRCSGLLAARRVVRGRLRCCARAARAAGDSFEEAAPGLPSARGCAATGAGRTHAYHSARRRRPSTGWVPPHGPTVPRRSSRRPARPPAAAIPRRSMT